MRIGTLARGLCLAFAVALTASPAAATNVVMLAVPGVASVQKDQTLLVAVSLQFDDITLGGGFDLVFSPALFSYQSFAFASGLGDDPAFRMKPADGASAGPYTIAFGSFSGITSGRSVGTLELIANADVVFGSGSTLLSAIDNAMPAGPFVDTQGAALPVDYEGLIGVVVPEPSTLLLVGVGLAGAAGARRGRA
jgi:hypothetical protein